MTLFSQNIQLGIDSLTNGSREDALGNYLEAKHLYKKGIEYFMNEINCKLSIF